MKGTARKRARQLLRNMKTGNALENLLDMMGEKTTAIPKEITELKEQLTYVEKTIGVQSVPVQLEKGWQQTHAGYYIAESSQGYTALFPCANGGYVYFDEGAKQFHEVKDSDLFEEEAYEVYPSLPASCNTPAKAVLYWMKKQSTVLGTFVLAAFLFVCSMACLPQLCYELLWRIAAGADKITDFVVYLGMTLLGCGCMGWEAKNLLQHIASHIKQLEIEYLAYSTNLAEERQAQACGSTIRCFLLGTMGLFWDLVLLGYMAWVLPSMLRQAVFLLIWGVVGSMLPLRKACGGTLCGIWLTLLFSLSCLQVWEAGFGIAQSGQYLVAAFELACSMIFCLGSVPDVVGRIKHVQYTRKKRDTRPPLTYCDGTLELDGAVVGDIGPLSLTIGQGEKIGIYGHAGCGKTVVLQLLAGILTPSTGLAYCSEKDRTALYEDGQYSGVQYTVDSRKVQDILHEKPDIVLLDHVGDAKSVKLLLAAPCTSIFASTRKELLKGCQNIYRMEQGQLVEERR